MWPAGLEPAARRVSDDRSTRLSYGHVDGRGWTRTSSLLFVRQVLSALELLAPVELPGKLRDKDSNLGLRGQSAASWPLDDPGSLKSLYVSPHTLGAAAMLSMPLAYASALDRRSQGRATCERTSFVEAFWSPALAVAS